MILKYFLIALLSLLLLGFLVSPSGARGDLIKGDLGRWGFFNWLKISAAMVALHIWYCSLLLQPLSWLQLVLAWFVLFIVFGFLYEGFLKPRLAPFCRLVLDAIEITLGVWVIKQFIV